MLDHSLGVQIHFLVTTPVQGLEPFRGRGLGLPSIVNPLSLSVFQDKHRANLQREKTKMHLKRKPT